MSHRSSRQNVGELMRHALRKNNVQYARSSNAVEYKQREMLLASGDIGVRYL